MHFRTLVKEFPDNPDDDREKLMSARIKSQYETSVIVISVTELGYEVGPRLRVLAPRGQREPGGGIHATQGPSFSPSLHACDAPAYLLGMYCLSSFMASVTFGLARSFTLSLIGKKGLYWLLPCQSHIVAENSNVKWTD